MRLVSQSPNDTQAIAAKLADRLLSASSGRLQATVVALHGELGTGKTTFTQGFTRALKIATKPKSPTFILAKQYSVPGTSLSLWHLDCYRLAGRRDLISLDLHSLFTDPKNIMLIEWPERIGDGLPRDHVEVHLAHKGGNKREITIKG